jgi:hypothetical protein
MKVAEYAVLLEEERIIEGTVEHLMDIQKDN